MPRPKTDISTEGFTGTQALKDLFRWSPMPTALVDGRSRRIAAANRAFADLTGYSAPTLRKMTMHDLDRAPSEVDQYLLLAIAGVDDQPQRRTFTTRGDTEVDVEIQAISIGGDHSPLLALFVRNVT